MPDTSEITSRILAIDLGKKRVGLAISDPLGNFAVGLETLTRNRQTDLMAYLQTICNRYNVSTVVLGLPVNMNGSEGPKAQEARTFGQSLTEQLGIPVCFEDERLTSVVAQQALQAQGIQPSKNKGAIDQTAATLILQGFLDRRSS